VRHPDPAPLPRRVPQRQTAGQDPARRTATGPTGPTAASAARAGQPYAAGPGTHPGRTAGQQHPEHDRAPDRDGNRDGNRDRDGADSGDVRDKGDGGARPLRRRVRGATLATTLADAGRAARRAPRQADAEEVRSELDEFEAAVERANRDVASGAVPGTTNSQAGLPEGADQ
jgi:hypothetical protein